MSNVKAKHGRNCHNRARAAEIDLTLAVLCVRFAGQPLDYREIARACGMSHGGPFMIAQGALRKLRVRLKFGDKKTLGRDLAA